MRGFAAIHLRRLRAHPVRVLLSLLAIGVGSLLVVAVLCLFGSITGSVAGLAHMAGHADAEVSTSTDGGMDQSLVDTVRAVPGVAAVTAVVRTPVAVNGIDALLVGADNASGGSLGSSCLRDVHPVLTARGLPVVVGSALADAAHVHAGDSISVYGSGRATTAGVVAVLRCSSGKQLDAGRFVAAPLSPAITLSGREGRIDSIFVTARPRAGNIIGAVTAAVAGRADVSSPTERLRLAGKALQPFQSGLSLAISLVFIVAAFLVFNTMSMAALERRRELATMRALGARRRPLVVGFLGEAAVLGLVGSVIGTVAGTFVARASLHSVPTIFVDLLGVRPRFVVPPTAVPSGVILGTLASIAAGWFPARSAVRVPPVEAMRPEGTLEAGTTRNRPLIGVAGLVLAGVGTILTLTAPATLAVAGTGAVTVGTVIATYGLSKSIGVGVARIAGVAGAAGRLAAAGIERAPRRVWATTLAVTVGVGTVVTLGGLIANQQRTFADDFKPIVRTSLFVEASTVDTIPVQAQIPPEWADAIRAMPGVTAISRDQSAYITLGGEEVLLEGLEPAANNAFFLASGEGGRRALRGDGVILSKAWAQRHHLHIGDVVRLPTPAGLQTPTVVGTADEPIPVQGELGIDYTRFTSWFGRRAMGDIEVMTRPGDVTAVKAAIDHLTAGSPLPVHVFTGAQVWAGTKRSLAEYISIFHAIQWTVVAATALAVLNTMAIAVLERRRELGILRAVGTSRRRIRRMVVAEAAALTVGGLMLGAAVGVVQHVGGVRATSLLTGFTVSYRFVFFPLVLAALSAIAMTVVGSLGPAWRAARTDVIAAIGYE